jgi:hypothetical protein
MVTEPTFEKLQSQLIRAFRPSINVSAPNLMVVLRRSLSFAQIQNEKREIIVDREAFLLAVVAVGIEPASYPNTSQWFGNWLKSRIEPPLLKTLLNEARTPDSALTKAQQGSFRVKPSASMSNILPTAVQYAAETVGQSSASLRHLFVAVAADPNHHLEIPALNWELSSDERPRLIAHLQTEIARKPSPSENLEKWKLILSGIRAAPGVDADMPPTGQTSGAPDKRAATKSSAPKKPVAAAKIPARALAPALLLSGFSADRTKFSAKGTAHPADSDPLGTRSDVQAMARLICHEDADPPISIGIFGGWGSGKSTFMERLQDEVDALTEGPPIGPAGARFVRPVVQIRFNAWQFADADLWASLTAEFFDQLRAGGFRGKGDKIQARLVEDVNQHVRGLSQEAANSRAALTQADEKLRKAKVERAQALADQKRKVGQAAVSALVDAYQNNRGQLLRLGLMPAAVGDEMTRFVTIAREANSQWGQAKVIGRTLKAHPIFLLVGTLLLIGVAGAAYYNWGGLGAIAAAAAAALPFVAALLQTTRAIVERLSPLAARLRDADAAGLNNVLEKELDLRAAEDEAEALRDAAARADRALARYVDPNAPSNPPRLLRYLLEDDPETKVFEKEIGLMGRARRLFEALDKIVQVRHEKGVAGQDVPARIILYIDDLDRCTHEQVYRVLQAVHLLLAFRLFVVIVAVDVKWVEGAVEKHLEIVASGDDSADDKRARSIEYLSKIFQLPFWLKPLSGKDDARFADYVKSLTGPGVTAGGSGSDTRSKDAGAKRSAKDSSTADQAGSGESEGSEAGGGEAQERTRKGRKSKAKKIESALRAMELDAREVAFLASPAIAAIASSDPRGVKRLVNVYKIARSRFSEIDDGMILGDNSQAPAYPLIALVAAIETGQRYKVADRFYAHLRQEGKGGQLMKSLLSAAWGTALIDAVAAAIVERGDRDASYDEVAAVARVVRRYSFNRYH